MSSAAGLRTTPRLTRPTIRAGSLVELMKTHNYTLIYTFEVLEALLVYQAIPGDRSFPSVPTCSLSPSCRRSHPSRVPRITRA